MELDSTLQETLQAIEAVIEEKKITIQKGEALKRLKTNKDFQLIIMEGLIESEAKKLFDILTDPSGACPLSREELQLQLAALSYVKGYINTIEADAQYAPMEIAAEQDFRKNETATVQGDR